MSLLRRLLCPAVLLVAMLAVPAHATRLLLLDTPTLAQRSQDIVVGRVLSTRSYWDDRHTRIFTEVVVSVDETLKGSTDANGTLTLTQLGGRVDGARYDVPGSPRFVNGEEALLFVYRGPTGRAQVNGMAQGKFDIITDAESGEKLVQRTLPGLAVKDLHTMALAPGDAPARRFRLSELRAEIQSALTSAPAEAK
ncbi:MAG: hypothetical protein ABL977_01570 [Candidatus Eisenbacteria bacterium]